VNGDLLAARIAARRDELAGFASVWRSLECVSSTNDVAASLALDGVNEGAWVVADEQTAGRGRRGRHWASPPGAGLYCSIVFRPRIATDAAPGTHAADSLLTLTAGVAAAEAIRRLGVPATLKWPNDVIVERTVGRDRGWRKLGGVLAEASTAGAELQFVVLGVGVNLTRDAYPPSLASRATSMDAEGGVADRDALLIEFLVSLAAWRRRTQLAGVEGMLDAWRTLSPMATDTEVHWTAPDGLVATGVTRGIDQSGALLVETERGPARIVSGEVSWPSDWHN
jgi:BirA family biotin operon repressor/biotin-[acetyl-CoA-carboxylase] ligase